MQLNKRKRALLLVYLQYIFCIHTQEESSGHSQSCSAQEGVRVGVPGGEEEGGGERGGHRHHHQHHHQIQQLHPRCCSDSGAKVPAPFSWPFSSRRHCALAVVTVLETALFSWSIFWYFCLEALRLSTATFILAKKIGPVSCLFSCSRRHCANPLLVLKSCVGVTALVCRSPNSVYCLLRVYLYWRTWCTLLMLFPAGIPIRD